MNGASNEWSGLVLYFSRWASLARWAQVGHLNREAAYYAHLSRAFGGVTWVTYGGEQDLQIARSLQGIHVVSNCDRLSPVEFAQSVREEILKHKNELRAIKVHQLSGAYEAYLASRNTGVPLIVRCGNVRNYWIYLERGMQKITEWMHLRKALKAAGRFLAPTEEEAEYARRHFFVQQAKVRIVPNFVQTDLFHPQPEGRQKGLLGFVGSLKPAKNLKSLVQALAGLPDVRLRIIGEGRDKEAIASLADQLSVNVEFIRYQPNENLSQYLNECQIFVFPSLREGHPKALLEAMACGLPVVTTPVYGIRGLIRHRMNGYLCDDTSVPSIRKGILDVLRDEHLQAEMGSNARAFVVGHFDMPLVLEREIQIYRELNCLV